MIGRIAPFLFVLLLVGVTCNPNTAPQPVPSTVAATPSVTTGEDGPSPSTTVATIESVATSVRQPDVVIDIVWAEGYATGTEPVVLASLGDLVQITVVSDTPDEVHIHGGYDLFFGLPRAQEVTFSFIADRPGVFAVELETLGQTLFELDVG